MIWRLSNRADPAAVPLADRHYNRQTPGSPQFVPPGRCIVLLHGDPAAALWVTSWPIAAYVRHAWPGAWMCSCFRREAGPLASVMIREAVAVTRGIFKAPPELGMITFLDRRHVRPVMRRGVKTWGRTWELAGFRHIGATKGGLMAWQLLPQDMPEPLIMRGPLFDQCWPGGVIATPAADLPVDR